MKQWLVFKTESVLHIKQKLARFPADYSEGVNKLLEADIIKIKWLI